MIFNSIKLKLLLPLVMGFVLIIGIIQFYFQPNYIQTSKIRFIQQAHILIEASINGIALNLLERDLGHLFSNLEYLENYHKGKWNNLQLLNRQGQRLYPLFLNEKHKTPSIGYIHLTHPINIEGSKLGTFKIDVNWGKEKATIIHNFEQVRNLIIVVLTIIILISVFNEYHWIFLPLKRLLFATKNIAKGNFDISLPKASKDEMGTLIQSFSAMLVKLNFKNTAIEQHAIVSEFNQSLKFININERFIKMIGPDVKSIQENMTFKNVLSPESDEQFFNEVLPTLEDGNIWHGILIFNNHKAEIYWLNTTIVPFDGNTPISKRFFCIQTDKSKQKKSEKKLRHLANHDNLTGLPTRILLREHLTQALARADRYDHRLAVAFVDLDGFKAVNDIHGHDIGDLLLIEVSNKLKDILRASDVVSRVGGDEFILLLNTIKNRQRISRVSGKIIDELSAPFIIKGKSLSIGASVGISVYPDDAKDADRLIKCADDAMYTIKKNGKRNYAFYDHEIHQENEAMRLMEMGLKKALLNNEFQLVYQPQINILENTISGVESLIRWNNTELNNPSPEKFIVIAESIGIMPEIGGWILKQAISDQILMSKHFPNLNCKMSINLSGRELHDIKSIQRKLEYIKTTLPSFNNLTFEITETSLISNFERARASLNLLASEGFNIALDDFGTGYSSLKYLTELPISIIKIDRSFVINMHEDKKNAEIIKAILHMAETLNLTVISEGVEEESQVTMLKEFGCPIFQGYYFAHPMKVEALIDYISEKSF